MSEYYDAFEVSPVPVPGPDAVAPAPFRGIYGMPSFVTVPTPDLAASVDFWVRGLGFFELFAVPGRLVHLRRWAFQDVLLVPTDSAQREVPAVSISFACVLNQIEGIVASCRSLDAAAVSDPRDTPWNTRDLEVTTPEKVRVVFTAAKPFDPAGPAAEALAGIGITVPEPSTEDNGEHA